MRGLSVAASSTMDRGTPWRGAPLPLLLADPDRDGDGEDVELDAGAAADSEYPRLRRPLIRPLLRPDSELERLRDCVALAAELSSRNALACSAVACADLRAACARADANRMLQSGRILSIVTTSGEFAGTDPRRRAGWLGGGVGAERVDDSADVEDAGVLDGDGDAAGLVSMAHSESLGVPRNPLLKMFSGASVECSFLMPLGSRPERYGQGAYVTPKSGSMQ